MRTNKEKRGVRKEKREKRSKDRRGGQTTEIGNGVGGGQSKHTKKKALQQYPLELTTVLTSEVWS
jgi:hypothetical protein